MRTVRAGVLLALALAAAAATRAVAEDADSGELDVSAAVATIESDVLAWAKLVPAEGELRAEVLEASDSIVGDAHQKSYMTLTPKLRELRTRLASRREQLIFGTAQPETPAPKRDERELAEIDVRAVLGGDTFSDAAPNVGLRGPRRAMASGALESARSTGRSIEPEKLRDLAEAALRFDGEESPAVQIVNGALLVRATRPGVARLRELVERLRVATGARISLDVRTYAMPRALYSELARAGTTGVALSAEGEALLARSVASGMASALGQRTTLARDGQNVASFSGDLRTYVGEVDAPADAPIARITSVLCTGDRLLCRPVLLPGRQTIQLDFALALAEPTGSIAKEPVLGSEVELPELRFERVATTAEIPLGRTTLLAGTFAAARPDEKEPLLRVVAVRPTLVADHPTGAASKPLPGVTPTSPDPVVSVSPAVKQELALIDGLERQIDATVTRLSEIYRYAFYDVRCLLDSREDRRGLPLGLFFPEPPVAQPGSGAFTFSDGPGVYGPETLEALIKVLTGGDEVWGEPASYDAQGDILIVHQTPVLHARIEGVLASLGRSRGRALRYEASLYRFEAGFAESLAALGAKDGEPAGVLTEAALEALDDAVSKGRAAPLAGGFVLAQEGERVYVEQGNERASVVGFERLADWPVAFHPVLALVRTGTILSFFGQSGAAPGEELSVVAQATRAAESERHYAPSSRGRIETPDLAVDLLGARAAVRPGRALLVTAPGAGRAGLLAFVVRPAAP
jgi:hypothetical protein